MSKTSEAMQPIGVPGLKLWGDMVISEWMPDLVDRNKRYKVFQEMERDATVSALLKSITMPLLAAEVDVEPPDEADEIDEQNTDFISSCLDDMNGYTWRRHERDALSALIYGWSCSEIILKKRLGMDAEPASHYNDGRLGIKILDPRGQNTLTGWKMTPDFDIEAMHQQDPNSLEPKVIPYWKLIHCAFNARNRNPEGLSPMMECYRAWRFKTNLETVEGIGIERDLAGLPVIRLPYNANSADAAKAQELVANIRNDEQAGVVLPAPRTADKDAQKWDLTLLSGAGGKMYNARETIQGYIKQILMTFFAQFLTLGMDKVGTQALVEGSQDFFTLALVGVQQEIVEVWNQQLVPLLYSVNNLAHPRGYAKITWHPPGRTDVAAMANQLNLLVNARIITPESGIEDHIRGMMGLPDRPEGVGEGDRPAWSPFQPPPMQAPTAAPPEPTETLAQKPKRPRVLTGMTDDYKRELSKVYKSWCDKMAEELSTSGGKAAMMARVDKRLSDLLSDLTRMGERRIRHAYLVAMRGRDSERAEKAMQARIRENGKYLRESFIPAIREKIEATIDEQAKKNSKTYAVPVAALALSLMGLESRMQMYGGQVWAGFWEATKILGQEDAEEAKSKGQPTRRVKWVLGDGNPHCEDCLSYVGEYDSWDEMPTVPGGENCRCLVNCTCQILVQEGDEWVSVAA
jgi:hypothetical protein